MNRMHGPCDARGGPLACAARLPILAALPALGGCTPSVAAGAPWLFGCVALLLSAAGAWGFGTLRERHRAEAALRDARREQQLLAGLVEGWSWQTDGRHRLLHLQPPAGAPAAHWAQGTEAGGLLWERFECPQSARGDSLRSRMEAQVPFDALRVRRAADGSDWVLRGLPRLDDHGRFAGYAGTARPTAVEDTRIADQDALAALIAALELPALLAFGDGSPEGWRLRDASAPARRLLDIEAGDGGAGLHWADLLPRLPSPLRNAIAEARPESAAEHEGWHLRRFGTVAGEGLWLVHLPQPQSETASEGASLSYTVSHDLRAPVRVVEGFTRILKEDYGRALDRVGNDHLDRVLGAAARMNHMIDALLTLARLSQQPLARQPVNLSQLAAYIVDDLRRGAPERAADIEIEPGLSANGDPTLLRLVLENLLGNAWKYSARAKKASIVFGSEPHEGRRAFFVRDNGAGFDMRSADRLFGLFQRLHSNNEFPGTGVGLASVQRIVRRHGGAVWAEAEPGRGATFHFTLRE